MSLLNVGADRSFIKIFKHKTKNKEGLKDKEGKIIMEEHPTAYVTRVYHAEKKSDGSRLSANIFVYFTKDTVELPEDGDFIEIKKGFVSTYYQFPKGYVHYIMVSSFRIITKDEYYESTRRQTKKLTKDGLF